MTTHRDTIVEDLILRINKYLPAIVGEAKNPYCTAGRVGEFFTIQEVTYLPKLDLYHIPSIPQLINAIALAQKMDVIRSFFNRRIIVHSWVRPEHVNSTLPGVTGTNYNKLIGGSEHSGHITASAIDYHIDGFEGIIGCREAREVIVKSGLLEKLHLRMEDREGDWIHNDNKGYGLFTP